MYSHFFNVTVCLLWLSTMTWLVTQKVLPSLWVGEPPSYQTILEAQQREPPGGWNLFINDKRLGWAISTIEGQEQGPKEIHSHVHFDELPLAEMTRGWVRVLIRMIEQPVDNFQMDVYSTLSLDSLGKLSRFDSRVQLEPVNKILRMFGSVDGSQLHVEIHSSDFSYSSEVMLPQHALLSDALSPQTQLPNLRMGQTWTVPAFSPLCPTNSPFELLHATVRGKEPFFWNGEIHDAWLVVYQSDPGLVFGANSRPRGSLWVLDDGRVIKQQAMIFDSTLSFVRMSEEDAAELVIKCQEEASNIGF